MGVRVYSGRLERGEGVGIVCYYVFGILFFSDVRYTEFEVV